MSSLSKSLYENNLVRILNLLINVICFKFVDHLKNHLNQVSNQIKRVDDRMKNLESESTDFILRLQTVQNEMSGLKHKRYVQEVLINFSFDRREF